MVIVVAPTGAGKNYILKQIKEVGYVNAVSDTTRSMRFGEEEGIDYYYISEEEFQIRIATGRYIESINLSGTNYGMRGEEIGKILDIKKIPYIIVEPVGLQQILNFFNKFNEFANINIVFLDIPRPVRYKNILLDLDWKYTREDKKLIRYNAKKRINRGGDDIAERTHHYLNSPDFIKLFYSNVNTIRVFYTNKKSGINDIAKFIRGEVFDKINLFIENRDLKSTTPNIFKEFIFKYVIKPDRDMMIPPIIEVENRIAFYQDYHKELDFSIYLNSLDLKNLHETIKQFEQDVKYNAPINKDPFILKSYESEVNYAIQEPKKKPRLTIGDSKKWYGIRINNGQVRVRVFHEYAYTNQNCKNLLVKLITTNGKKVKDDPIWIINQTRIDTPHIKWDNPQFVYAEVYTRDPELVDFYIKIMIETICDYFDDYIQKIKNDKKEYKKLKSNNNFDL